MLANANFLCEIGTEEIPAGYIPPIIEATEKIVAHAFNEKRLDFDEIKVYATPRRIAIAVSNLAENQREEMVELKGPSGKAAYDGDGKPSKALEGFLRGNGLTAEDVVLRETEKGEYVFASKKLPSNKTESIIPEVIENLVKTLPSPKKMHWSDKAIFFPRPIRYFMILFNDNPVDFELEGIKSSNLTRGHFVQHDEMMKVEQISNYETILEKGGVILDQDKRRSIIHDQLKTAAKNAGGSLNEDPELLETVTYIVENPNIIVCEFDESFLKVPDIVLIAEMREHQKYFAVVDHTGKLMNKFLVISNNPETEYIKKGNVKVISARFSDAEFFYDEDRKVKLSDRVEALKKVLFHKELGSVYDKIERMGSIGSTIANALRVDRDISQSIERAIFLSKSDLDTAMVNEFASLQGQIGAIYAMNEGEESEVARAIDDHYRPRFNGDRIPENIVSIVASLAEKIDNILGSFSVGNIPKGSQDPYALRRQAHAIVELVIHNKIDLNLAHIIREVASKYSGGAELVEPVMEFVAARFKTILSDRGLKYDEIDACLIPGSGNYLEVLRKAESLHEFRKKEGFSELLLGLKRMNNIVSGFRKKNEGYELQFDSSKLELEEEKSLHIFFQEREGEISKYIAEREYIKLFELMSGAKPVIDSFFDNVMVMDERVEVRDCRLGLLESITERFSNLMDFSKISDK